MQRLDSNKKVDFGVISLLALALFLILFIFYIIGANKKIFSTKYSLYMFVENAEGLNSGAYITLSGVKVGAVDDISFASRQKQHGIRIELKIQKEYTSLITSSSQASIKNLGMLGDKYVDISLGDVGDQPLNEGSFIKSQPSVDIDFFMEKASSLFQMLDTTLAHITSITNAAKKGQGTLGMLIRDQSTRDHLVTSLKNIDQITSGIMKGEGTLGKMTRDTLLYKRLFSSADGVSNLTHKINSGRGSFGKFVNDSTFYLKWLDVSMKTDSLLTKLQGEGTTGKLLRDKQLYRNLVSLTQTLNELLTDLKKNPDKYVKFELF